MSKNKLKYYYIYKTTNLINGKIYVGKRVRNVHPDRDGYLGSGKILRYAIEKHGRENFEKHILEICHKDNINEREVYWIEFFNSCDTNIGYNITKGGTGGDTNSGIKKSESSKIKASITRKKQGNTINHINAKKNPEYLKRQSDATKLMWANPEFKRKMKEKLKEDYASGRRVGTKGIKFSEESRRKISEKRKCRLYCLDTLTETDCVFNSCKEADQYFEVKTSYYISTGNLYKQQFLFKKID